MKKIYFLLLAISALSVQGFAHVNLLTPSGSVTYNAGETVTLEWQIAISHNIQNWDLFFSEDNGSTWDTLQIDIPSTGNSVGLIMTYDWIVPNISTTEAKIWIYMDNAATDYDDVSSAFTIVGTVGLQEYLNQDYIHLYPNPVRAGEELNLSFQDNEFSNGSIQIVDVTGKQIEYYLRENSSGAKVQSLELIGIKTGSYYLLFTDQNAIVTRKPFIVIDN